MIFNKVSENFAELNINDEIGFWGISHQDFTNQLKEVGEVDIQLNIASYGGVVSDAFAIYNSLKSHKGRVIANIYGDSASSATFIAMAADEIRIADNAMFLIHNVWGGVTGDAAELRKQADLMDKINDNIIDVYKKKTGLNKNTIKSLMNKEEWWTAKEAKDNGFVDTVVEANEIINRSESVLMNCANEEMKKALLDKVNKLNNHKNNFEMTEENKGWFDSKFEELKNFFNKEAAPKIEEQPKAETISEEQVSELMNKVEENVNALKDEHKNNLTEKETEIAALKAEIEKLQNKKTEVKADVKSPDATDEEKTVIKASYVAETTLSRLVNKYSTLLKTK